MINYVNKLEVKGFNFTLLEYYMLLEKLEKIGNLNNQEKKIMQESDVAKILAAIPYFAGCKNPDQHAILKMLMYLAGFRDKEFFAHRENQTMRERIKMGLLYPDGDQEIIDFAAVLLEIISLNDHKNDLEEDRNNKHSNPILSGNISYFDIKIILIERLKGFDHDIYNQFQKLFKRDLITLIFW